MRVHLVIPMPSFILTAIDDDGTNTTKELCDSLELIYKEHRIRMHETK